MYDLLLLFLQINPSTARCVSWDFDTVSWITDGCTTTIVDNSTFSCSCTHLTNFAVLVVSVLTCTAYNVLYKTPCAVVGVLFHFPVIVSALRTFAEELRTV